MSDPHPPVEVVVRRGAYTVWAVAVRSGADLVVTLGGGARSHVGCVALAQARPSTADPAVTSATTSLLAIPPHKEGELAARLASILASALNCVVVVAAGIHDDGIGPEGVASYVQLVSDVERQLLRRLKG